METQVGQATLGELMPALIGIVVCIGLIALCVKGFRTASKNKKKQKEIFKERGISQHSFFMHINGLPVAENTPCEIFSLPDKYEIKASGMSFNLEKQKVTDVCIKTDTEIQKQYVSSIGGAVGGALLFGPLGAVIGGRAKKKKTKTVSRYLIITYMSENEVKYVGFDVTNAVYAASKYVDEFMRSSVVKTANIDL